MGNIYEERIQELLSKMTLEEKVGQLQQCGPSLVGAFEVSFEELLNMMFDGKISKEEFEQLMGTATQDFHEDDLRAGRIGSYNGVGDAATANRLQKIAVEESRLGIPLLFGYDVIHGFKTITPIPLAEACAWEPQLWEATAHMAACEATAGGVHMTFAPMVDVARDARWGRVSEGAGEDPLLAGMYGAAKVRGFQGNDLGAEDSMAACVKHFAAYGAAEAGRDYNRVDMSMQKLYEEYLPPFEACVKAGARAIMPAFNDINGVPCSVNGWLLRDVLRRDWGFDGMTVSDSNAIAECVVHGAVADRREAAAAALNARMDMDMSSNVYAENLVALVRDGQVSEDVLNEAVADILRVKFELGLFDHPYKTSVEREASAMLGRQHRRLALAAAEKSMVLLKNDAVNGHPVLPLKSGIRLGIAGPLAADRGEMLGAWAIGGDGNACVSLVDACRARGINFQYCEGYGSGKVDGPGLEALAENCDVIIAAVGERKDQSGEAASRADISLDKEQLEMLQILVDSGLPVVAVLFNGRPLAMPWVAEHVPAILEAWHPGVEAGNAILNLLMGVVAPSGKLTVTFPYTTGQCPMYYAHINTGRPGGRGKFTSKYLDTPLEPVYPFGYGLSYTTFEYKNMSVIREGAAYVVTVDIANTGSRDGEEIAQCYVCDVAAGRVRPVKQLKAFAKVQIPAGETETVRFTVPVDELGYYDMQMNYVVEPGEFEFFAGGNSVDCMSQKVVLEA